MQIFPVWQLIELRLTIFQRFILTSLSITVKSKPNVLIILICFLFRSADGQHDETYGKINCVVRSDGMVHWIPPAKFRVFCDVDLTNWPFGEHTCSLRLGSWTYDGNSVSMQINQKINVRLVYINYCFIFLQHDFIILPLELTHKQCCARIIFLFRYLN